MTSVDQNTERMALLRGWLESRLAPEQRVWLDDQVARIANSNAGPALALAIGLAPRKLGKADLALTPDEIAAARVLRPGLDPSGWSVDQTARIVFVLASFDGDEARFAERLDKLFASGEIGEHMALFRGLPLYPAPDHLVARAAEGIRSAVQPVFEAVAHANPYPYEQFSETQWNHMVLKALFIGSALAPIQGLDLRRNSDLAKMLIDYAHERWAAGRPVSPELWRGVGPFADEAGVADLAKVLRDGSDRERRAAALALAECPRPSARAALDIAPELAGAARDRRISWQTIV
jgi:hypothetical protein